MEFGKRYTREREKWQDFYFDNYGFCVKSGVCFLKRKTLFLTELIFAKQTLEISCFEPNEMLNLNEI